MCRPRGTRCDSFENHNPRSTVKFKRRYSCLDAVRFVPILSEVPGKPLWVFPVYVWLHGESTPSRRGHLCPLCPRGWGHSFAAEPEVSTHYF